ncbi:HotDog domain-containing protein [Zopfochytrium polystomum]|nr:HotDog domain-containing protein [Zopfochytrium polystomum]
MHSMAKKMRRPPPSPITVAAHRALIHSRHALAAAAVFSGAPSRGLITSSSSSSSGAAVGFTRYATISVPPPLASTTRHSPSGRCLPSRGLTTSATTDYPSGSGDQDPKLDLGLQAAPVIWSVLPQNRGRTTTTNRLWINRYLQRKENAHQAAVSTNKPVDAGPLLQKRMVDSLVEEYLPFGTDPAVREDYVNAYGSIRIGKILEDLDALAGSIAYMHCDDGRDDTPPLTIVTASLDRIDMINRIPADIDVVLSGFVSYVGTSSMEISIKMETLPSGVPKEVLSTNPTINGKFLDNTAGTERIAALLSNGGGGHAYDVSSATPPQQPPSTDRKPILAAKFTMVARDPITGKATPINQLKLETDEERRLFRLAAEQKARKQVAVQTSLARRPPSAEEMLLVHDLYLEYRNYLDPAYHMPDTVIWMKDTVQQTLVQCQPQDRNIHNNIFGGYLMRLGYQLAHATSLLYAGKRVYFVSLDDISFRRPVPIGSLLALTSEVTYAKGAPAKSLIVKVRAEVVDPLSGRRELSNEFWFTFVCPEGGLRRVLPRSYDESMRYLDGKRRRDAWSLASKHNTALFGADRLAGWSIEDSPIGERGDPNGVAKTATPTDDDDDDDDDDLDDKVDENKAGSSNSSTGSTGSRSSSSKQ